MHADGNLPDDPAPAEHFKEARRLVSLGFDHIRLQYNGYGANIPAAKKPPPRPQGAGDGPTAPDAAYDPVSYLINTPKMFAYARKELGDKIELCHDTHERLEPPQTVQLAKSVEPYRLFFLEDSIRPEYAAHFATIRQHSTVPLAMGELFVNVNEYLPLIKDRLIDFIRVHMSDIGGITPMRKLAALCEYFGVRTALHGPGDCSPVGMMANLAIGLASSNFGIQEYEIRCFSPHVEHSEFCSNAEKIAAVFPGFEKHQLKDGMMWPNDLPGLGVDIDEVQASKYPWPSGDSAANPGPNGWN
eukprot:SAG31_NODE_7792_length_1595_cov_1.037433_2_plen_300_part_01